MIFKVWIIVTVVIITFSVLGWGPQALAQQTEKWYTYHKPLEFSIDYPDFQGKTANITETRIQGYPVTYIDAGTVFMIITKSHNPYMDPQEIAVLNKQTILNTTAETMIQDIFTSVYDGEIGYTFVTTDSENQSITSHTIIQHGKYSYDFNLVGMSFYPKTVDNINHVLDSIKFFD